MRSNNGQNHTWTWLFACATVVSLCLAISSHSSPNAALGQVRKTTPREHFKSGGARSEAVLREIHTTLRSIDARLARIERKMPDPNAPARPAGNR